MLVFCWHVFDRYTNFKFINLNVDLKHRRAFLESTEISASEDLKHRQAFLESTKISASEDLKHRRAFLESTEISASEDLNALEKAPPQIMPLWILSGKGAVQIMLFRKLGRKFHFFLRFCTRKRSETYVFFCIFYLIKDDENCHKKLFFVYLLTAI